MVAGGGGAGQSGSVSPAGGGEGAPSSPGGFGATSGGAADGRAAVRAALEALDERKAHSLELTTGVRVETGAREEARRSAEERRRLERLHRVQEEALVSEKANTAVELRWRDLGEHNMPLELHREMEVQREACDAILASKDELIREFQAELKAKDEEYVKGLQRQRVELDQLLLRMHTQFREMRDSYGAELSAVEEVFREEREALLKRQEAQLQELMRRRQEAEARYTADRVRAEAEYARALDAAQAADADEYAKLKIKLETDIQTLEQQLAVMRATYLLNQEKLDYNYRVLIEREADNEEAAAAQKEKVKRLELALTRVTNEYAAADKHHRERNATLTTEFRRVTRQFRELQIKAGQFAASDRARFAQVRRMHADELRGMVQRLLDADRVITEQVLGWQWTAPGALPVLPTLPSRHAARAGGGAGGGGAEGAAAAAEGEAGGEERGGGEAEEEATDGTRSVFGRAMQSAAVSAWALRVCGALRDVGEGGGDADADADGDGESKEGAGAAPGGGEEALRDVLEEEQNKERAARVRVLLELLVEEASFLVPLQRASADDVEKAACILSALGVADDAALSLLLAHFFRDATSASGKTSKLDQARASLVVSPELVVPHLKAFVAARSAGRDRDADDADSDAGLADATSALRRRATDDSAAAAAGGGMGIGTGAGAAPAAAAKAGSAALPTPASADADAPASAAGSDALAVALDGSAEERFWTDMANVVPHRTIRVWTSLEKALERYHRILQDRQRSLQAVSQLRAQNDQLRALLKQYLTADVNKTMQVAPAATLALAEHHH